MQISRRWLLASLTVYAISGCKKSTVQIPVGGSGKSEVAATDQKPAQVSAGMIDPFARLTGDSTKALNAGYKALREKRWDEARTQFEAVVKASPDYSPARFQAARATALGGHFTEVADAWRELLARDYIAYAGRLDKPKDLAPLRASPEWAKVQKVETELRAQFAAGFDKGFFFVARAREPGPDKSVGDAMAVDLQQEAWHFDPTTQHYRRVTDTDGHVFAIDLSPDRKTLSFLVVKKMQPLEGGIPGFVEPLAGVVDLTTLATTGPFAIHETVPEVTLSFGPKGEPAWAMSSDSRAWTFDAAKTAMVSVELVTHADAPSSTRALADAVEHFGSNDGTAKLATDAMSIAIAGTAEPLRAARVIAASSLEWSPGKKRLAYAGSISACKILKQGKPTKEDRNELFVWDAEKKSASRVAQAVSAFDVLWLDDDHLVYEGGVGKEGKLHIFELSTRNDTVLKTRFGAGLFGYPQLKCDEPPSDAPEENPDPKGDSAEAGD